MRIIDALIWGDGELKAAGVESPRWDADALLGHVLRLKRESLYLGRERLLTPEEQTEYQMKISQRAKREPLQYILGQQEFMGLDFYVDQRVLIPRADSELLIEQLLVLKKEWDAAETAPDATLDAKQHSGLAQRRSPKIVDLCTGSGALAIATAHYWLNARVVATDLSKDALEVAQVNARKNGVQIEWRQGDFLAPIQGETWDIIISNPPYVTQEEYETLAPEIFREPELAFLGGDEGLYFYRQLAGQARSLLKPGGKILLEIGWQQGAVVEALFRQQGFATQIFQDYGQRDRVVLVR